MFFNICSLSNNRSCRHRRELNMQNEKIILAGGCFWCIEPIFKKLKGVLSVVSGYTGGKTSNPTYDDICTGVTGHAEALEIEFDKSQISLAELLEVFFTIHDPTMLNRQGADIGTQYRSAVFYNNEEQKLAVQEAILKANQAGIWNGPIVTSLEPAAEFYQAEQYHQDFFSKNPSNRYCQFSVIPKLKKLDDLFSNLQQ